MSFFSKGRGPGRRLDTVIPITSINVALGQPCLREILNRGHFSLVYPQVILLEPKCDATPHAMADLKYFFKTKDFRINSNMMNDDTAAITVPQRRCVCGWGWGGCPHVSGFQLGRSLSRAGVPLAPRTGSRAPLALRRGSKRSRFKTAPFHPLNCNRPSHLQTVSKRAPATGSERVRVLGTLGGLSPPGHHLTGQKGRVCVCFH